MDLFEKSSFGDSLARLFRKGNSDTQNQLGLQALAHG
jgi:hypothetical protein